ncbi:MAG: CapA family protein, partial [Clostridia bacterium]|nr:CapA family protein [Clostridia bacterium]
MKSKVICLCLCVVAVAVTMLMTVKLIYSENVDPPVISVSKDDPHKNDTSKKEGAVELNSNAIAAFADKIEGFVTRLAYDADKEYEKELTFIIDNLDSVSEYLSDDKSGANYLTALSETFKKAKEGYINDTDFSMSVGRALSDLEAKKSLIKNNELYPDIDTSANGALTLALLSIYEKSASSADTYTVTVGGGALMGDRLGTTAELKFSSQISKYNHLYPFHAISSVTSSDDLTVISLEAPLTTATESQSFNPSKGSPEYASRLLGINAVSIASSAMRDYGDEGFDETVKALRENGISYSVQEGSETVLSDFGKVVYITFDLTDTPVTDEQKARNEEVVKQAVEREKTAGADLVVALIHWNTRQRKTDSLSSDYLGTAISVYESHFDAYNKEIARASISAGADLVVGYGSRVIQGIELYRGKYIVYETGDLSYSGSLDAEKKDTNYAFLFRQTFKKEGNAIKPVSYRIIPIVNTSEENLYLPTPV